LHQQSEKSFGCQILSGDLPMSRSYPDGFVHLSSYSFQKDHFRQAEQHSNVQSRYSDNVRDGVNSAATN